MGHEKRYNSHVFRIPKREEREFQDGKWFKEILAEIAKFGKNQKHKFKNPSEAQTKWIQTNPHHNKTTENKKENRSWKQLQELGTYLERMTIQIRTDFSSATIRPEGSGTIYSRCWKKEQSTQNSLLRENIL